MHHKQSLEAFHQNFWTALRQRTALNYSLGSPAIKPRHWVQFPFVMAGVYSVLTISVREHWLKAEVRLRGDEGQHRFDYLKQQHASLAHEAGIAPQCLEWNPRKGDNLVMCFRRNVDVSDGTLWTEHQDWLLEHLERLTRACVTYL